MIETNEVVFDDKAGISVEEQKEILSKINGIAEKNRRALSQSSLGTKPAINAKKSGAVFPLAVNIASVVILAVGVLLLVSFNGKKDAQVRTGGAVFNLTERALIEEIRKETADKIALKESEIASISSRLEEVDNQLTQLYSSNQELTTEQLAAQQRLLASQLSFRADLSALQEERSRILEDSRSREERLRAQLEERAREFSAAQKRVTGERDSAVSELERLSGEQEKTAALDAQLSGGLAVIADAVQESRYDQALQAVENLRLLNNSAVTRSFQSRREFYNKAIDSFEAMIAQLRKDSGADSGREHWDLQVKNTQLEDKIVEMQKSIDAFNAGSSGQAARLTELETQLSTLRAANSSLEAASAEKDRSISSLETEKTTLTQTVTELRTANSAQEQEIANLRNQLTIIRQALQE